MNEGWRLSRRYIKDEETKTYPMKKVIIITCKTDDKVKLLFMIWAHFESQAIDNQAFKSGI